jgi:hypothetical protein
VRLGLWAAAFCVAAGCGRSGARVEARINAAPFKTYTERLATAASASVTVRACDMFGPTRKGYCIVDGAAGEPAKLATGLGLDAATIAKGPGGQTCLDLAGFGHPGPGGKREADPGVTAYRKGSAALPPNTNNVRFVTLFVGAAGTSACIEYDYPYG